MGGSEGGSGEGWMCREHVKGCVWCAGRNGLRFFMWRTWEAFGTKEDIEKVVSSVNEGMRMEEYG